MIQENEQGTALRVERLVQGGAALVRSEAGIVFVEGALPGELIEIGPMRRSSGRSEADLVRILEASPDRREAPCALYGTCGGCDWQHLSYPAQLQWKREIVSENARRIGGIGIAPGEIGTVAGAEFGYRSRVQVHQSGGDRPGEQNAIGFRRRRSSEVVPVSECPVATAAINGELGRLPQDPPAQARTVLVESEKGVGRSDRDREASLSVGSVVFTFDPGGFAQANRGLLPQLAAALRVADGNSAGDPTGEDSATTVIDLYAGAGLLSVMVADRGRRLICVEPDRRNARFIRANLRRAGAEQITVVRQTAERAIRAEPISACRRARTTVILDPPRGGLSRQVRAWLTGNEGPFRRLLYLSCDAAALARDLGALHAAYRILSTTIFDFYPQTSHIETLVVLEGINAPAS